MAVNVFRRMLRLTHPSESIQSLDGKLIEHLERMEGESPHRMQEWIRGALRNELSRELLALDTAKKIEEGQSK